MFLEGKDAVEAVDKIQLAKGPCKGKSFLYGLRAGLIAGLIDVGNITVDDAKAIWTSFGYDPAELEALL